MGDIWRSPEGHRWAPFCKWLCSTKLHFMGSNFMGSNFRTMVDVSQLAHSWIQEAEHLLSQWWLGLSGFRVLLVICSLRLDVGFLYPLNNRTYLLEHIWSFCSNFCIDQLFPGPNSKYRHLVLLEFKGFRS